MGITQRTIASNPETNQVVIEHNDNYHGKDHVCFLRLEYLPLGRYITHKHRKLPAALKAAGIKVEV